MENGPVTAAACVARRAMVAACLACANCGTDTCTDAGRIGVIGGRLTDLVTAVSCLVCVGHGMAAGISTGKGIAHTIALYIRGSIPHFATF